MSIAGPLHVDSDGTTSGIILNYLYQFNLLIMTNFLFLFFFFSFPLGGPSLSFLSELHQSRVPDRLFSGTINDKQQTHAKNQWYLS